MSKKRIQVTMEIEEENYDVYKEILQKIMKASPESRGPAAKAVMAAFQIYTDMIGGSAARTEKLTR